MANYYNQIRKGKTIRKRLEILLSVQPLKVSGIAANRNPEPYVYDQTNPDEVHEFFAAYLEIFLTDREEAPSQRRAQEEAKWHEVIDKLEERFILFKGKVENSNNSEITAVKATAKSDLDYKLKVHIKEREQEFKSIGVNAFHSVSDSPQAIATYITDKLEEHRQEKKSEQIQGKLTPRERAWRILEPDLPNFIHTRFFQAFVGYKYEELKKAIDDYEPQSEIKTSSLGAWPMSDEVLERFREQQLSFKHLCLFCYAYNWNPRHYDSKKYSKIETATRPFLERAGRLGNNKNTGLMNGVKTKSNYTLQELVKWLDISEDKTLRYVKDVVNLGITEEKKKRFNLILLD